MEAARHDAVRRIERLLDTVAVVAINVNIQDAGEGAQELEDAQDNVVYVAEARSFAFLRVVQTASPIDGNVSGAACYALSGG